MDLVKALGFALAQLYGVMCIVTLFPGVGLVEAQCIIVATGAVAILLTS